MNSTNTKTGRKAVIIAPFWKQETHVGLRRVERFRRWFENAGIETVIVHEGPSDNLLQSPSGTEISIRGPLSAISGLKSGNAPQSGGGADSKSSTGGFSSVKSLLYPSARELAYLLFPPDPGVFWSKRAAKHPLVLKHAAGAGWIVSSSPPESSHLASTEIASKTGAKLVIDLRDGWLDEPLKPSLQNSSFARMKEGRIEEAVLRSASHVFVTSEKWKHLLIDRYSFIVSKTTTVFNCYPDSPRPDRSAATNNNERITLLHAGRFTGSSNARKGSLIFEPLLKGIEKSDIKGDILLIGKFQAEDLKEIEAFKPRFEKAGWGLELRAPVPGKELLNMLCKANGLLLLSASNAAIPSKFFEYLWSSRPMLCAAPEGSETWNIAGGISSVTRFDYKGPTEKSAIAAADFLTACASGAKYEKPTEFEETFQKKVFLDALGIE